MIKANKSEISEVFRFYKMIIDHMNTEGLRIGWDIDKYPDLKFIEEMIENDEMILLKDNNKIICATAVNHNVNPEYDTIDWEIKGPAEKISSIHALAVHPDYRGRNTRLFNVGTMCCSPYYFSY